MTALDMIWNIVQLTHNACEEFKDCKVCPFSVPDGDRLGCCLTKSLKRLVEYVPDGEKI